MEEFDKRSVQLLPDKMQLMTDTELTQYFMKTWILDFNDPGESHHAWRDLDLKDLANDH